MKKSASNTDVDLSKLDPSIVEMPTDLVENGKKGGRDADSDEDADADADQDDDGDGKAKDGEEGDEDEDAGDDDADRNEDRDRGRGRRRGGESTGIVAQLAEQVGQLRGQLEALSKGGGSSNTGPTDADLEKMAEETGMTKPALRMMMGSTVNLYNRIMGDIQRDLAPIQRRMILDGVSKEKGFEDAHRYSSKVDKILERFPANMQNNPEVVKFAILSARGENFGRAVHKARNERERSRKVIDRVVDRNPAGGRDKGRRSGLTGEKARFQDSIRRRFGMGKKEYESLQTGG